MTAARTTRKLGALAALVATLVLLGACSSASPSASSTTTPSPSGSGPFIGPPLPSGYVFPSSSPTASSSANPSVSPSPVPTPYVITVDDFTDAPDATPGDGACSTAAGHCSLRAAVAQAAGKTVPTLIDLPAGTYSLASPIAVSGDVEIVGNGQDQSLIDGAGRTRLFTLDDHSHLVLRMLALRNGHAVGGAGGPASDWDAGAVWSQGDLEIIDSSVLDNTGRTPGAVYSSGTLLIRHSLFRGNKAQAPAPNPPGAGGALSISGTALIEDSLFDRNTAGASGGAISASAVDLTIRGSVLQQNQAAVGGALSFSGGSLTIERSAYLANNADKWGGAMMISEYTQPSVVTISDTGFRGNAAKTRPGTGGAIRVDGGQVSISSSMFTENHASGGNGGAISISWGGLSVVNSTLTNDTAGDPGAEISAGTPPLVGGPRPEPYDITIAFSTLAGPSGRLVIARYKSDVHSGDMVSITGSIVVRADVKAACDGLKPVSRGGNVTDASCGAGPADRSGAAPAGAKSSPALGWLLGPLIDAGGKLVRMPVKGSAAIDAAAGVADCPLVDAVGTTRPQGLACDAGAIELPVAAP